MHGQPNRGAREQVLRARAQKPSTQKPQLAGRQRGAPAMFWFSNKRRPANKRARSVAQSALNIHQAPVKLCRLSNARRPDPQASRQFD